MTQPTSDPREGKRQIRAIGHARRRSQPDKDRLSGEICHKVLSLPEYVDARTVMCYVDVRDEVRTRPLLSAALNAGKRVVIPYCVAGDRLELFRMESLDELAVGTFGILEPTDAWRDREDRRVDPLELDLIVVPGVAFDRRGGRVGHGRGYYDRLLQQARPDTTLVALAFECQLVEEVPMQPHDVSMDMVVTETAIHPKK
ncbi:MAG: 5-formyltetrahydrofolate cyclo-ligase [Thermoguttaceae bacterium]